jgi:hypothetical protein
VTGTVRECLCKFLLLYCFVLLELREVADKLYRKIEVHISLQFFFPKNLVMLKIITRNMALEEQPRNSYLHACLLWADVIIQWHSVHSVY